MSRVNCIDGVTLTNANQTGIGWDLQSLNVFKNVPNGSKLAGTWPEKINF